GEEVNYASSSRELTCLARWVLASAEMIIVNSRNTGRLLQEEWSLPGTRVRLLHPGVNTELFVPAPRDPGVRAYLSWGKRPVILTVGRLQRRKGQDQMIRALGAIRTAIPDVLYAIAGDGDERLALESLTAEAGQQNHVQFLGELEDSKLLECYQQCDLFALPNRQVGKDIEGFGMVLAEAQACGRPVLAGASGGTEEAMSVGKTGQVVPCERPGPLAAAVIDLLSDRERLDRMGIAGREWVVKHLDWRTLSQQAQELFAEFSNVAPQRLGATSE